ncbi:MAG TPA: glycosyltransferase [Phycisphaerae bacterium]|nr:glycosyltransferase [Phycisphaerae bacterium]
MTASVIIVTLNRPDCVRRCLDCLRVQTLAPHQIIVVDGSTDDLTRALCAEYPDVLYLRNDRGVGHMTHSRNIGILRATGDVIAFIDDDAFAEPQWLENILAAYDAPDVGAVGGRVHSTPRNVGTVPADQIGRFTANGIFLPNFWADCGKTIDVEHLMGCNMSFRRDVVAQLGGFREFLIGISGVGEDTEMCVRVRRSGFRMRFNPAAAVDHIGAPQVKGKRFDVRYAFFGGRNYNILLLRNFSLFAVVPWRYAIYSNVRGFARCVKHPSDFSRACAFAAGTLVGWTIALFMLIRHGTSPVRSDPAGIEIRRWLSNERPRSASQTSTNSLPLSPAECPSSAS